MRINEIIVESNGDWRWGELIDRDQLDGGQNPDIYLNGYDTIELPPDRFDGEQRQSAEERVRELAREAGVDISQPGIQRFAQLMIRELKGHGLKEGYNKQGQTGNIYEFVLIASERVRELNREAGLRTDASGQWVKAENVEKFSELIVDEIAKLLRDEVKEGENLEEDTSVNMSPYKDAIKNSETPKKKSAKSKVEILQQK